MVTECAPRPNLLVQNATLAALPCLSGDVHEPAINMLTFEDHEAAIIEAVLAAPEAVVLIEHSSLTSSIVQELESSHPGPLKLVVRVDELQPAQVEDAVTLGCAGVITPSLTRQALARMLASLDAGEMWLERKWSSYLIRQFRQKQRRPKLSKREYDVLNLLQRRLKNREMAHELAISEETLRWHLRHLYAKTKRRSRGDLVLYAQALNSGQGDVQPGAELTKAAH